MEKAERRRSAETMVASDLEIIIMLEIGLDWVGEFVVLVVSGCSRLVKGCCLLFALLLCLDCECKGKKGNDICCMLSWGLPRLVHSCTMAAMPSLVACRMSSIHSFIHSRFARLSLDLGIRFFD